MRYHVIRAQFEYGNNHNELGSLGVKNLKTNIKQY